MRPVPATMSVAMPSAKAMMPSSVMAEGLPPVAGRLPPTLMVVVVGTPAPLFGSIVVVVVPAAVVVVEPATVVVEPTTVVVEPATVVVTTTLVVVDASVVGVGQAVGFRSCSWSG